MSLRNRELAVQRFSLMQSLKNFAIIYASNDDPFNTERHHLRDTLDKIILFFPEMTSPSVDKQIMPLKLPKYREISEYVSKNLKRDV